MTDKTGFVGLGKMGEPMARNLLQAGVPLVVHDIDARKVQAMSAEGAAVAARATPWCSAPSEQTSVWWSASTGRPHHGRHTAGPMARHGTTCDAVGVPRAGEQGTGDVEIGVGGDVAARGC